MARLKFDEVGQRKYTTGVSDTVLFPMDSDGTYKNGIAWSGMKNITEKPSGAEQTEVYADNILYLTMTSAEKYALSTSSYYTPEEFDACDGTAEPIKGVKIGQQNRQSFGLAYKTNIGNDVLGEGYGYKIKCVYGLKASVTEKNHETINDNPEAAELTHEMTATPVPVDGYKPTAVIEFDSTVLTKEQMKIVEDTIYGTESTEPTLLSPNEFFTKLREVQQPAG